MAGGEEDERRNEGREGGCTWLTRFHGLYRLRCLNRKAAVLKFTGGSECSNVIKHCSRASGSDRPVEWNRNTGMY